SKSNLLGRSGMGWGDDPGKASDAPGGAPDEAHNTGAATGLQPALEHFTGSRAGRVTPCNERPVGCFHGGVSGGARGGLSRRPPFTRTHDRPCSSPSKA